eukprot:TRINITY_DN3870_c0_g1_i5.p1 TRINITY_DN3870_c0_g1~~TRINITY_DN3870_c0_g1_i5.p1  ORF type:complete len:410 (-),score=81.73 TRINITY_DN3870_c0_g1_i5:95-1324(-)
MSVLKSSRPPQHQSRQTTTAQVLEHRLERHLTAPTQCCLSVKIFPLETDSQKRESSEYKKTLCLGAGEQGKRVFFLSCLNYFEGINEKSRLEYAHSIIQYILYSFETLAHIINNSHHLASKLSESSQAFPPIALQAARDHDQHDVNPSEEYFRKALEFTQDPAFKEIIRFENFRSFQVLESFWYDVVPILHKYAPLFTGSSTYIPDVQDVLFTRIRTTGIIEAKFQVDSDVRSLLVLVGGQRNERKKWIHSLDGIDCLLFFLSLVDYDKNLFEDNSFNRMEENLILFHDMAGSRFVSHLPCINVILSRHDTLQQKLAQGCFPGVDEASGTKLGFHLDPSTTDPQSVERQWIDFLKTRVKQIADSKKMKVRFIGPTDFHHNWESAATVLATALSNPSGSWKKFDRIGILS